MGLISEIVNSDIILLAIITVTISPFLFNRIYPQQEEKIRSGIIVVGQDQLAEYVIENLQQCDENVVAVCPDQSRVEAFQELGVVIVEGCETFDAALNKAGAEYARVLLDLTSNSEETLEVCKLGKEKFNIPLVVTRISDVELIPTLNEMEVKVVQPELATAMALEGVIRYPTAFDVLIHQNEDIDVTEILVTNPLYADIRLGEIRLPGDALILSLHRDNTVMVPQGDTVLQLHDRLGLIGSPIYVEEASAMLKG